MKETDKQIEKLRLLFLTFFKIGIFTFGGGYAMIPLIEYEIVERHQWIGSKELLDVFAIAQATPGVIAVNTATFVGYKVAGFWGSLLATIGVIMPSFMIISIISLFFVQFQKIEWVAYAFSGIRVGVIVLILGAVINLGKKNQYTPLTVLVLVLAFGVAAFTKISIIFLIIGGALIGIIYQVILKKGLVSDKESEDKS